ncbi:MAG: hypothetical protein H7A35_15885 [Planctomycetales bacterium]|nr:hypothetical protein [bacterium]UNM08309.1 MAG: hypothetical protein H7A35_15885 [Planctomycetales bacterium]
MSANWTSAIRGLRDNPLPALWQLQELRQHGQRSRWLSSPGYMLLAILVSALACYLLLLQLGMAGAVWQEGAHPVIRHSLRGMGFGVSLAFTGAISFLLAMARLHHGILFCGSLLAMRDSRRRWAFDEVVASTELGNREIIAAAIWHSLRRVMPPLALSQLVFSVMSGIWVADMLHDHSLPDAAWRWLLPLLFLLGMLLLSTLAVATLCALSISTSSPDQHPAQPMLLAANAYPLQLLMLAAQLLLPIWRPDEYYTEAPSLLVVNPLDVVSLGFGMLMPVIMVLLLELMCRAGNTRSYAAFALLPVVGLLLAFGWGVMSIVYDELLSSTYPLDGPLFSLASNWCIFPLYLSYPLQDLARNGIPGYAIHWMSLCLFPVHLLLLLGALYKFAQRAAGNLDRELRV